VGRRDLLEALRAEGVRFVVIGGVAMVLRGSSRTTLDLELCYERSNDNLERLARAIQPFSPTLRGAPPGLPFIWDAQTLRSGLNFTLSTTAGDLDLLGEVTGLGAFDTVTSHASELELYGVPYLVLDLDGLELSKRAAGRVKDLLDLAEIETIRRRSS
jgi:hypothetical protein